MSPDSELSIKKYWEKHRNTIATVRHWKQPVETRKSYDKMMEKMAKTEPAIIKRKSINELSVMDILQALESVRYYRGHDRPYGDRTMTGYLSLFRDIFKYAESCCHAINIIDKYTNTIFNRSYDKKEKRDSSVAALFKSDIDRGDTIRRIEESVEKRGYLRKSLTMSEMQSLMKMIKGHYMEDGRYLGLAICMFAGLRTNEVRALSWEDIHSTRDDPVTHYFSIHHVIDRKDRERPWPKTSNGFRNIPIHHELKFLLLQRYQFILKQTGKRPRGYICCMGNDFGKVCSYPSFAVFAKEKVFSRLNDDLVFAAESEMAILELSESALSDPDDNITLYVLRRNFWTWLQYGSQCSQYEKLYIMGHELPKDQKKMRDHFATPQALQKILHGMNQFWVLPDYPLHERIIDFLIPTAEIPEAGIVDIIINPPVDGSAVLEVTIEASTLEADDQLTFELCMPIKGVYNNSFTAADHSILPSPSSTHILNTSASTCFAIENSRKRHIHSPTTARKLDPIAE